MRVLASIGSPSSGVVHLGSITIHLYGLTLLIAIVAATVVAGVRWARRGGDWDLIFRCAVWGVGFGIVGARLYHLATSWDEVPDAWWGPFAIWKGGLGVWGGIAAGCLAGALIARRAGADWRVLADCLAPGLLLAQGIGRVGNYFNQELFGRPTRLPWALQIDPAHYPSGRFYPAGTTFHPTFLYELLWDFLAAAILLLIVERRLRPRAAGVFAAYIALYCFGRFWTELLRIDPAHRIGPLRLNDWVAIVGFLAAGTWFLRLRRRRSPGQWTPSHPRQPRGQRRPDPPVKPPESMAIPRSRR